MSSHSIKTTSYTCPPLDKQPLNIELLNTNSTDTAPMGETMKGNSNISRDQDHVRYLHKTRIINTLLTECTAVSSEALLMQFDLNWGATC